MDERCRCPQCMADRSREERESMWEDLLRGFAAAVLPLRDRDEREALENAGALA